jgi:hypothetical protein
MKARMIDIAGCSPRANAEESNDPLYASQTIYIGDFRIQNGVLKAHVFHVNCRITSLKCLGLIVRDAHVSHLYNWSVLRNTAESAQHMRLLDNVSHLGAV